MTGCTTAFIDPFTKMEFVHVKGGWYEMGSNNGEKEEKPVHDVCVSDFWIGKYEVKQSEWNMVMGNNLSMNRCGGDCPVESISWQDAQQFIQKLNEKSGSNYRLPTEAEWEYAARSGGKDQKWAGTSEPSAIGDYARFYDNSASNSNPVGTRKPNGLGIYDMSGNVYEWCQDVYDETYYQNSPDINPLGPVSGEYRVAKGGSGRADVEQVRTSYRFGLHPNYANRSTGLRLSFVDKNEKDASCRQVAPVINLKDTVEKPIDEMKRPTSSDIDGTWKNPNSSRLIFFAADGNGYWDPDQAKKIDKEQYEKFARFTWTISENGDLTITSQNPFSSKMLTITTKGHYHSDKKQICINRDEEKCGISFYPFRDEYYINKLKRKIPTVEQTGGRYLFTEETVKDTATGLIWAREGDLAKSRTDEIDLHKGLTLINELNKRNYGGRNDWRLPRFSEFKTLIDSVTNESTTAAHSGDDNIHISLMKIGFISIIGGHCYLTSDLCHPNNNCWIDLKYLKSSCNSYNNKEILPVAGNDFRKVDKNKRIK